MISIEPICLKCAHYNTGKPDDIKLTCKTFPGGIPDVIFLMQANHRKPFKGDGGIRFKPMPERAKQQPKP